MMNKQIFVWVFALIVALPAHADKGAAMQAFKEGNMLFDQGEYSEAAVQFRKAYEEEPTWKLLYNIGQCEAGAKNYGLALEAFEQYIVEAGDDIDDMRRQEVQKEIARLRPLVGFLKVEGPDGTILTINGLNRGTLPLSGLIPVSAAREFEVSGQLNGEVTATETIKLMTGQTYTVYLTADAESSEQPNQIEPAEPTSGMSESNESSEDAQPLEADSKPVAESPSSGLKKAGIALTLTGTVIGVGGFTVGGIAFLTAKKLEEVNPNGVSGDALVQRDQLQNIALVGDILMGVGGAVALTGIILLLVNKKRQKESINASVMPMLGQNTGLLLEGRF
ncbi:MAG: tetratricopeptide repeat protein [Deltaproteobacteria bacterium]|nr:tetratricopeptide repeat protein [Deltaproteobacteria bacterium]MBN2673397.1 tetratricopeptide repeat protein [Deltaproteobacteria bacterium]